MVHEENAVRLCHTFTMTELTIAGRDRTSVSGLLLTAFSLVFVVAGIVLVVESAHHAATYLPATATVESATGMARASREVSIVYSFSVNGKRYVGREFDHDSDSHGIPRSVRHNSELRQYTVGQQLTIYYDPRDPSRSQRFVKADASGLVFTILAVPFLAMGLSLLWRRSRDRDTIRSCPSNAPGEISCGFDMFFVLAFTCLVGTLGHLVLCATVRWPWSLVGGLIVIFVVIPAVSLGANHVITRWRMKRKKG